MPRDAHCHACGGPLPQTPYPRTCAACGTIVYANPIPVGVALVPVDDAGGPRSAGGPLDGLLVIRRAIPPGIGKLALVGGFVEAHETWQQGCAREVREETGLVIDPARLEPFWYVSTEPRPDRVLLFAVAAPIAAAALPPFQPDHEVSERGIVRGARGLSEVFAFPLHAEAVRRYFLARQVDREHGFVRL